MNVIVRTLCAAAFASLAYLPSVAAQPAKQPSAAAAALAREIIEAKGALKMFDTVIAGVVEYHKGILMQTNVMLQKDLDEVGARLKKEFAPRTKEIQEQIVLAYASRFTEQELKELVAFFKSPLGKKLSVEEPAAVDEATKRVDGWANKFSEEVLVRMRAEMKKKGHNL